METQPVSVQEAISLGEGFELDSRGYTLRRTGRAVKLERIPMELLLLLVEHSGQVITRDQIVERIWGKGAFLDTDNSINGAIRKIRQALKDDPEKPRFVQTVTGRGYRFIAETANAAEERPSGPPERQIPVDLRVPVGEGARISQPSGGLALRSP